MQARCALGIDTLSTRLVFVGYALKSPLGGFAPQTPHQRGIAPLESQFYFNKAPRGSGALTFPPFWQRSRQKELGGLGEHCSPSGGLGAEPPKGGMGAKPPRGITGAEPPAIPHYSTDLRLSTILIFLSTPVIKALTIRENATVIRNANTNDSAWTERPNMTSSSSAVVMTNMHSP